MKPVSKTAYYCCGVRMTDAQKRRPLCGDMLAVRFMDAEGMRVYQPFQGDARAIRGNAARHRIIDDWLREQLARAPATRVISVGAGFDTRPYRLRGGAWIELDEAPIIALKQARLPDAECENPLERIAIEFGHEPLEDKLAAWRTDAEVCVVLEGVLMYLDEQAIVQTLRGLRQLFPRHTLICDLMRRRFLTEHAASVRALVEQLAATMHAVDQPEQLFLAAGYRFVQRTSIVARSLELSLPHLLRPLARCLPREIRDGYGVFVYRYDEPR